MKKFLALLLCLAMVFCFAACGKEEEKVEDPVNAAAELYEQGYELIMNTSDETSFLGMFLKDYDFSSVYKVSAKITAEEYEALNSLDWSAEDFAEKQKDMIIHFKDLEVTDITNLVPDQAELDSYIGMTLGELEDLGFYNSGWTKTDDGKSYNLWYDGPMYNVMIHLEDGVEIADMDDYSVNDIRALVIGGMEFNSLSLGALEQ